MGIVSVVMSEAESLGIRKGTLFTSRKERLLTSRDLNRVLEST